MGNDVLPGFCSGRSATRSSSQVLPAKRKTPGFSRHSTFIPGDARPNVGRPQDGVFGKAFCDVGHDAASFLIRVAHDDIVDERPLSIAC